MDKILGCKNRGLSSCLRWTEPALKLTGVERIAFRGILWFGVVVLSELSDGNTTLATKHVGDMNKIDKDDE
ncbi:hypothetical protein NC652_014186 [Populus alba x Populus x berolinensis]|nr:hypothetical protein NC652_014186 [Populus alba x Populus x berolinensis]